MSAEETAEEEEKPKERVSSLSTSSTTDERVSSLSARKNIRSATESEKNITSTTESEWGSCRSEAWHCFSSNMEEGVRNLHRPNDLVGSVQQVLYKAVFHGGLKSMWSSVMELPSARSLGSCLSGHDRCMEHTVLAREVDSAGW